MRRRFPSALIISLKASELNAEKIHQSITWWEEWYQPTYQRWNQCHNEHFAISKIYGPLGHKEACHPSFVYGGARPTNWFPQFSNYSKVSLFSSASSKWIISQLFRCRYGHLGSSSCIHDTVSGWFWLVSVVTSRKNYYESPGCVVCFWYNSKFPNWVHSPRDHYYGPTKNCQVSALFDSVNLNEGFMLIKMHLGGIGIIFQLGFWLIFLGRFHLNGLSMENLCPPASLWNWSNTSKYQSFFAFLAY